jgi:hypothetical protein
MDGWTVDGWVSQDGHNKGLLNIPYHIYAVHSEGIMCVHMWGIDTFSALSVFGWESKSI